METPRLHEAAMQRVLSAMGRMAQDGEVRDRGITLTAGGLIVSRKQDSASLDVVVVIDIGWVWRDDVL